MAFPLVEFEQRPSSVLDRVGDMQGGFAEQNNKLNGTPGTGKSEEVDGDAVRPWGRACLSLP